MNYPSLEDFSQGRYEDFLAKREQWKSSWSATEKGIEDIEASIKSFRVGINKKEKWNHQDKPFEAIGYTFFDLSDICNERTIKRIASLNIKDCKDYVRSELKRKAKERDDKRPLNVELWKSFVMDILNAWRKKVEDNHYYFCVNRDQTELKARFLLNIDYMINDGQFIAELANVLADMEGFPQIPKSDLDISHFIAVMKELESNGFLSGFNQKIHLPLFGYDVTTDNIQNFTPIKWEKNLASLKHFIEKALLKLVQAENIRTINKSISKIFCEKEESLAQAFCRFNTCRSNGKKTNQDKDAELIDKILEEARRNQEKMQKVSKRVLK